ncbi:MAG TPA: hemolysin family protein [Chthoniobacterales bacterium]
MILHTFLLAAAAAHEAPHSEWASSGVIFWQLFVIAFLVFLNGFFVASEFALVKVRGSQIDAAVEEGVSRAKFAKHVNEHLDAYLSATQLGITLASLGLGWVGEPYLARMIEPVFVKIGLGNPTVITTASFAIAFTIITFLHIVLGELTPKSLAIRKALGTSLMVAQPLALFHWLFRPAIWLLNGAANKVLKYVFKVNPVGETELAHSEEELRLILTESAESEEVSTLGKEILMNALDMRRRVVRDIMTPRGEVVFLDTGEDFETNLKVAVESGHTRFPLCKEHLDNTIGLVHLKDLMREIQKPEKSLIALKRDLLPVPEMMPLEKLLKLFLGKHAHLAVVVDEFGGTVGVVTLDDVLAELVGNIQDEFDIEETEFRKISDDEFVAKGSLGLYELHDLADLTLESTEVSTIGGYVTHLLGHLPKQGEQVRVEDYVATITDTDGRRVLLVHFKREPKEDEPEGESKEDSRKSAEAEKRRE